MLLGQGQEHLQEPSAPLISETQLRLSFRPAGQGIPAGSALPPGTAESQAGNLHATVVIGAGK